MDKLWISWLRLDVKYILHIPSSRVLLDHLLICVALHAVRPSMCPSCRCPVAVSVLPCHSFAAVPLPCRPSMLHFAPMPYRGLFSTLGDHAARETRGSYFTSLSPPLLPFSPSSSPSKPFKTPPEAFLSTPAQNPLKTAYKAPESIHLSQRPMICIIIHPGTKVTRSPKNTCF